MPGRPSRGVVRCQNQPCGPYYFALCNNLTLCFFHASRIRLLPKVPTRSASTPRPKPDASVSRPPKASPRSDSTLRMVIARNVKAARTEAGLSQRELCNLTKITQSYLSQLEAGSWNLGVDNVAKLSRALGIPPHALLDPLWTPTPRRSQK